MVFTGRQFQRTLENAQDMYPVYGFRYTWLKIAAVSDRGQLDKPFKRSLSIYN